MCSSDLYEGHVGPMAIDAGRTYEGANAFYSDAPGRVAGTIPLLTI